METRQRKTSRQGNGAGEAGAALLLALLVTLLLSGLALAVATVTTFERVAAGDERQAVVVAHAADAALESAMQELGGIGDWSEILSGTAVSVHSDRQPSPSTAWGDRLDLAALTTDLQRQTDSSVDLGANTPRWRLFCSTGLSALTGVGAGEPWPYVLVWVADDRTETDDDPGVDSNDIVWLRARAVGPHDIRRDVEAVVRRVAAISGVQLLTWRALR
jgi:type II secretory pathway pseudopilin PulG